MSDTTQVLLIDGKPIGYFPPTSAENVTYEEGVSVKDALDELSSATKNGNAEFATLINNTDTTITRNALLVVIASVQENTQYGGYSVYINGLYVDGIGNVGLSNPAQTFTKSFHVNKGDVVKVVFNTAQGTTGTAKLYI